VAKKRRKKTKSPLGSFLLLIIFIALAAGLVFYVIQAQRLENENQDLKKKINKLEQEIETKNQQIGDLEIRLKIHEKGSIK
jgi:cell division protein FtsL